MFFILKQIITIEQMYTGPSVLEKATNHININSTMIIITIMLYLNKILNAKTYKY